MGNHKSTDIAGLSLIASSLSLPCGVASQKDMSWKDAINSPDRVKVEAAFKKEVDSLESTILTRVLDTNPDYDSKFNMATPGRWLLDVKRNGVVKCRGVKQGFKEDRVVADGPNFNYYSHVAKLTTVRTSIFRKNRGDRRLALKDVSTAFLQSNPYPDGKVKYLKMKNPFTAQWELWEQSGPIYGEASAPVHWENTVAPWLVSLGFIRGDNEPSVFHHPERDLLVLLYVDDVLMDGFDEDVDWLDAKMDQRFTCEPVINDRFDGRNRSQILNQLGDAVQHAAAQQEIGLCCLDLSSGRLHHCRIVCANSVGLPAMLHFADPHHAQCF